MAHTTVTGKADGQGGVFNHGFMTPFQNIADELLCAAVRDLILGLVTGASSLLHGGEKGCVIRSIDKLHFGFNDFHCVYPFW